MSGPTSPRFGRAAGLYRKRRPGYPEAIWTRLDEILGDGPRSHAIELGAGSGQATAALLGRFDRVTAVEPDPDMAALIPEHARLAVRVERAEDAAFDDGSADVVVAATAFHWMEAGPVCAMARAWLRPGGAFYVFGFDTGRIVAPAAVSALVVAEWDRWMTARDTRLASWRGYHGPIRATGVFAEVNEFEELATARYAARDYAELTMTHSFVRDYAERTGDADAYAERWSAALAAAANGEAVVVETPIRGAWAVA